MNKKTAIALSGGVDSLVSAFLLKQKSSRVFGIHFITGFEPPEYTDQIHETMASISDQLQIPVKTIDIRNEFKQQVVDYFIKSYQAGKTPNPCMVCNASIKFGTLLAFAKQHGADKLATGHYAKITKDTMGRCHLFRGADKTKDQTYFLSLLTQEQLNAACFPLADLTKTGVKALAKANHLIPAVKNESQDICFIRDDSYADFLSRQPGFIAGPGPIVDINDRRIGTHKGLHQYTIGQRRGINIPAAEPYYVVRLNPEENKLVVGFKPDLTVSECFVSNINWINEAPSSETAISVQVRYRHYAVPGTLFPTGADTAKIIFHNPQYAITPGQGAVFYIQNEVMGGGWFDSGK